MKISLIGAGSVVFARNLIGDILQYPALSDCTICLMDIDAGRLATIERLARRIVVHLGVAARIEATLDLETACRGASFAITMIQVGGYRPATVADFEIPARYGLRQTIGDTLGVGGVFRALRSIPELVKVARALEAGGAPDAVLLNYTNPMAMSMWAISRLASVPAVGLCHSVQGTSRQIAGYCGLDPEDVSYLVAGINHMAFFLKFEYRGRDAYPLLFRALEDPRIFSCDRVRFEMMRRLGYFVTESSEHQSEYVPYFIQHGDEVVERYDIPINEYLRRCEAQIATWDRTERDLLDESRPVTVSRSVEYGSSIIHAMVSGEPVVIYGNVPNQGVISNLPPECVIEAPCLVDGQGVQPTRVGRLPAQLAAIIRTNINVQELAVEAAVTRRREYIYQAVMLDPHTSSMLPLDKIWAMCDELIEAHQKAGFLGEFHPVKRNTGRPLAEVSRVFLSLRPLGVPFLDGSREAMFSLVADNTTPEDFFATVCIREASGLCEDIAVDVMVRQGESREIAVPVRLVRDWRGDALLALSCDAPGAFVRDCRIVPREKLALSRGRPVSVSIDWSGNRVASGALELLDDSLVLDMTVEDTDLRAVPEAFWEGSTVEVALKDFASGDGSCFVAVVVPTPGKSVVLVANRPFPGASAETEAGRDGYHLRAVVNLSAAGLAADRPFLLEIAVQVNALGTAHGRIRQAWQGSAQFIADQSRFALIVPAIA